MRISTFEVGRMNNLMYLIEEDDLLIIIDPSFGYDVIERYKERYRKVNVLLTHGHYDHVMDCRKIVDIFDEVKFYINLADDYLLPFKIHRVNDISGCDKLEFGKIVVRIIKTPGHSLGSVCYLIKDHLFTGDTLFYDCCGRVDLPGSDPKMMRRSLLKLIELDDDITLHPGHNYGGVEITLGKAKVENPYLKNASDEDLFLSMII